MNIVENIAIIKEVHEHLPTREAEGLAQTLLNTIGEGNIAQLRVNACTITQLFDAMIIRALMSNENKVIVMPLTGIDNSREMQRMLEHIHQLNKEKNIVFLDIMENEVYYKGCNLCNIVK